MRHGAENGGEAGQGRPVRMNDSPVGWTGANGAGPNAARDAGDVSMLGLNRSPDLRHLRRLRQEMDGLFDRFFKQQEGEEWMPGPVTRTLWSLQRDLHELFEGFFGSDCSWMAGPAEGGSFCPRVESVAAGGEFIVRAELPGFAPENVAVGVSGDTLTIRGERKPRPVSQHGHLGSNGSANGGTNGDGAPCGNGDHPRFSHTLTLPEPVDPAQIKATLAHGLLEIRLPSSPKPAGNPIPIEVGEGESPKDYRIQVRLPDVAPEKLQVKVVGNSLRIRGERSACGGANGGPVSRTFLLPGPVDQAQVKATLVNGILGIRILAPPDLAGKAVPIEVWAGEAKGVKVA